MTYYEITGVGEKNMTEMTINVPIDQVVYIYKQDSSIDPSGSQSDEEQQFGQIFHGVSYQD